MKRREALTLAAVWTDLEHMTLAQREAPDTQDSRRVTPQMRNIQNRPPPPAGTGSGLRAVRGWEGEGWLPTGVGGLFQGGELRGFPLNDSLTRTGTATRGQRLCQRPAWSRTRPVPGWELPDPVGRPYWVLGFLEECLF